MAYLGVLVTGVDPGGSCSGVLQPGDVLLSIDGRRVCADGTSELPLGGEGGGAEGQGEEGARGRRGQKQRVLFGHFANLAAVGDSMRMEIMRAGKEMELQIK